MVYNKVISLSIATTMSCLYSFFKELRGQYGDSVEYISRQLFIEENEALFCSEAEINFLLMIIGKLRVEYGKDYKFTEEALEEALKGGHLKFHDQGDLYEKLVAHLQPTLKTRRSSHDSCEQQYSFSGPVISEVLIGVSRDKEGNKRTWIQFEKHNMRTIIGLIMHLIDYLQYKLLGKNIGPYGKSEYTERRPFIIQST